MGLGFYEALHTGTPVITLDTAPHNEIIINGINGWTIPCYYKPMTDNNNGLIESAFFDPQILSNKIIEICLDKEKLGNISQSLFVDFIKRFNSDIFLNRLADAIN